MLSLVGWNEINIQNIVYLFLLVFDLEKLLFCHWLDRVYFVNSYPYSMLDWVSLEYLDEFLCVPYVCLCPLKNCTVYVMRNCNITFTSICPLLLSDSKRKLKTIICWCLVKLLTVFSSTCCFLSPTAHCYWIF